MNYNDGNWCGWNGGECPVHPETMVEVVSEHGADSGRASAMAPWGHEDGLSPIVAFRVIKEHRDPREFWANTEKSTILLSYGKNDNAEEFISAGYIHVREVIE